MNVNTIDSFQGGECDILLISTVRTYGVGFMDDMCRLNVALTRARKSLIICGNFTSLQVSHILTYLFIFFLQVLIYNYIFLNVYRENEYGMTY